MLHKKTPSCIKHRCFLLYGINSSIVFVFKGKVMSEKATHSTQRMEAECCIFMLFLRLRMLSEDWYTWMLTETEALEEIRY